MNVREILLTLPCPPGPNQWPKHPMEYAKRKNVYRRQCWIDAIQQHPPMAEPPDSVLVSPVFYLWNEMDEDNLAAALKWPLDALKQEQPGDVHWRSGVAWSKGYFVEDSPEHLTLIAPTQYIDRENPRLELLIRWSEEELAA